MLNIQTDGRVLYAAAWFLLIAVPVIHVTHGAADDLQSAATRQRGRHYDAEVRPAKPGGSNEIVFRFRNLEHRAPWCMFMIELDRSIDLSSDGQLILSFTQVSDDVTVKIEVRDEDSADLTYRSALRHERLAAGSNRTLRIQGKKTLDGLHPFGWQRKVLWPRWDRIRYIAVIVESRYNEIPTGLLRLNKIEHTQPDGTRTTLSIDGDRLQCFEYTPATTLRHPGQTDQDRLRHPRPSDTTPAQPPPHRSIPLADLTMKPEATETIKRDDPSSALFISGAGFKLELGGRSVAGVSGQGQLSEELHRIDDLLINEIRKRPLAADAGVPFDPRSMISEPIDVRRGATSIIFDLPHRPDSPRFTYTFEDTTVDSDSSIQLDFDLEVHEAAMLWTTPYLDDGRRFRLTLEPIYQYFRATGISEFDVVTKSPVVPRRKLREVHRGLINAVLHDEWNQRELFFQVLYGRADNIVDRVDESELLLRAEWRQWHGAQKTAFSTVGIAYREIDIDSAVDGLDGRSGDLEIFGNLIVELDKQGRWRWFNQATYNNHDVDIVVFDPVVVKLVSTNRLYDFVRFESRFTCEVLPDVDLSLGLEHAGADTHRFDSLGVVARASIFHFGPFRAEIGARRTWYYHLDDTLNTLFFKINFAR